MDGLTIGRICHYVISAQDNLTRIREGEHRAAIITNVFTQADPAHVHANMHVFWDGVNDEAKHPVLKLDAPGIDENMFSSAAGTIRMTPPNDKYSVPYSEGKEPGTWHWIEKA